MKARLRVLLIALALGAVAAAIGTTLYVIPDDDIPMVHIVTDLVAHFGLLRTAKTGLLGLRPPPILSQPNPNIGIITIDETSIGNTAAGLPPWPFPRSIYGRLLDRLKAAGAKTVAFDIVFLDPSIDPAQDAAFAAAMHEVPSVLAYTVATSSVGNWGEKPPAPSLAPFAAATGFSTVDQPGHVMIGQAPVIRTGAGGKYANGRFTSLAAAAVETYTHHRVDARAIPRLNGSLLFIPPTITTSQVTQSNGSEVLWQTPDFAGGGTISFADALTEPLADLRAFAQGRLIYVGATAQALGDFIQTPGGYIPGLFANARYADQLMRHIYLTPAPVWLNILLIVVLSLGLALVLSLMRPSHGIATAVAVIVIYAWLNLFFFIHELYWIDLLHVGIAMALATIFVSSFRVLHEGAQRRMVTEMFGMHVSPAIVSDILKQDDPRSALALRGKRVKATIFYSDIRGFTAMSETMTPEEIYGQLNEYFEEMCAIIFKYGGYVDKFIGDCVMAVFSAPYQTPDDARNAVLAAVEQQAKIRELSERWTSEGKREFTVGMGVNTGDVVMGNLGASSRMNYTVIGDNVNVAARLYNVAKGGEIIISETTYDEVKELVETQDREPVSVKGKSAPIAIYNVTGIKSGTPTPRTVA